MTTPSCATTDAATTDTTDTTSTSTRIRNAVKEAMALLQSEPLTLKSVARAYTLLQQTAVATAAATDADSVQTVGRPQQDVQEHSYRWKCIQSAILDQTEKGSTAIQHDTSKRTTTVLMDDNNYDDYNYDWISEQADLYRALLLTSVLWLEMMQMDDGYTNTTTTTADKNDKDCTTAAATASSATTTRTVLISSVEKSLLLLQVLSSMIHMYGSSSSSSKNTNHHHLHNPYKSLPRSKFALLEAVLDEPLVPLDKHERQYMYMLLVQQQQHQTSAKTKTRNDGDNYDNGHCNDGGDDDDDLETDNEYATIESVMVGLDRKQLVKEEKELRRLASKPIPTTAPSSTTTTVAFSSNGNQESTTTPPSLNHAGAKTGTSTSSGHSACFLSAAVSNGGMRSPVLLHQGPVAVVSLLSTDNSGEDDAFLVPLQKQCNETTTPPAGAALVSCHAQLYACGLVVLKKVFNNDTPEWSARCWRTTEAALLLTSSSTCEPKVVVQEDKCNDNKDDNKHTQNAAAHLSSFHIFIAACHSINVRTSNSTYVAEGNGTTASGAPEANASMFQMDDQYHETCGKSLQFQVDSLSEGYEWVTAIQRVVQDLKRATELQQEVRNEWKLDDSDNDDDMGVSS